MRAILTYHSVDPSGSPISIDQADFRRHVEWLSRASLRVSSLERLVQEDADDDAVALTFDDALESFASAAWPLLRDASLPVVLFVPSSRVGLDNRWGDIAEKGIPTLPLLDWSDLGRLAEEGVTLGAHSRTHRDLRSLDDAALEDELAGCAADIERETGVRPRAFAYPYGLTDARVRLATAHHYRLACTTELRTLTGRASRESLPRLDAYYYRRRGHLEAWGSPRFFIRLALRRLARRLRRPM